MRQEQNFSAKTAFGTLAAVLLLAGVAVTVSRSTEQDPAKTSYLMRLDMGHEWQTTLHLANLEDQPINLSLITRDTYGMPLGQGSGERHLQPREVQSIEARRELAPLSETVKIESRSNHMVAAAFQSFDGKKLEIIPAIRETSKDLVFPVLFPGDYSFKKLTLLNVESGMANLEIVALAKDRAELQRTFFPMLPFMASQTLDVDRLFSSETLGQVAAIRVLSDKELVGLQTVDPPGGDLVGLPALSTSSREWQFPILATLADRELWTSVGVFNPAETPASVTAEAFDAASASLGIIDRTTVAPLATHSLLIASEMPPEAAFLKMTADQPVRAWEVIGVKGAMGVTAAIGIAAEDPTVLGFELIGSVDGGSLAFSPLARMAGGGGRSGVGELRPEKLYRADMSPLSRQISWLAMPLKPMPLKPPGTNPEECTVEVKKIERFFPEEEKKKPVELKLDKKGVSTLEVVPDEQIWLRFDLEVMIPANHSVSFFILKSFLILDKKDIEFKLPRTAFEFKPPSLNGELKGKQTLEFHLTVPKEVPAPKEGGEANMEPTVGKTLEITLAWSCHKGFEDVSNGTLAKLRLIVEKKK